MQNVRLQGRYNSHRMLMDAGIASNERFEARLRPVTLLIAGCLFGTLIWLISIFEGDFRLLFAFAFALALSYGAYRFYRERRIISAGAIAMATVTERLQTSDSDGGYNYECQYLFSTSNGDAYSGRCESTVRDFPERGYRIEVIYNRQNPGDNFPREMFWFYSI